ncbi:MAG: hypothetical protein H0X33_13230 [Taibaiella sp.]|nr:hypothetical protein [Taibaiella sp.]
MSFDLGKSYLTFKTSDLEALARELLSDSVLEKAMSSALDEIERLLGENFESRQSEWKPLARSTQLQRLGQGYGPTSPILVRSGTLKGNAVSGREIEIKDGEVRGDVFPNDDAKAPYSDASLGDYMEALDKIRPFYDLSDEQMEKVYTKFEESLLSQLGA